ncbi:MAG TPA: STAS domain-containing protein [Thermoguttaceae bacterium]|nr:STAS domain-containing protein [Thermoguttaceae bacterium]
MENPTVKMLEIREVEDVIVVGFLHAKILDEVAIAQIGDEFQSLTMQAAADRKLLLNLEKIEFMASAMIAQIIKLHKLCAKDKITLRLCCISPNIAEVFKITGLNRLLDIYPTELKAMQAFAPFRRSRRK